MQTFNLKGAPFKGPAEAPIRVVEFSDFLCPYCRSDRGRLRQLPPAVGEPRRPLLQELPAGADVQPDAHAHRPPRRLQPRPGRDLRAGPGQVLAVPRPRVRRPARPTRASRTWSALAAGAGLDGAALAACMNGASARDRAGRGDPGRRSRARSTARRPSSSTAAACPASTTSCRRWTARRPRSACRPSARPPRARRRPAARALGRPWPTSSRSRGRCGRSRSCWRPRARTRSRSAPTSAGRARSRCCARTSTVLARDGRLTEVPGHRGRAGLHHHRARDHRAAARSSRSCARGCPPGVLELGPVLSLPKIKAVHDALGISSLAELKAAARGGPPARRDGLRREDGGEGAGRHRRPRDARRRRRCCTRPRARRTRCSSTCARRRRWRRAEIGGRAAAAARDGRPRIEVVVGASKPAAALEHALRASASVTNVLEQDAAAATVRLAAGLNAERRGRAAGALRGRAAIARRARTAHRAKLAVVAESRGLRLDDDGLTQDGRRAAPGAPRPTSTATSACPSSRPRCARTRARSRRR